MRCPVPFQHLHPVQHYADLIILPDIILVTEQDIFIFLILQGFLHQPEKVSGRAASVLCPMMQKHLFRIPSGVVLQHFPGSVIGTII